MAKKKKVAKKRAAKKKAIRKPAAVEEFKVEPHWLNKKQMAKALGISVQAFDKWEVQPVARRHKYGEAFYSVGDVVTFAEDRARENERKKLERFMPEGEDLEGVNPAELMLEQEVAKLRLTKAQARGQELKNEVNEKKQASVQMITWALSRIGQQISAALDPLPSKIKHRLPQLTTAEIHIIKDQVATCKNLAAEVRIDWDEFELDPDS